MLVLLGYLVPVFWVGWILTQPGDGSLGSGVLLVIQFIVVVTVSLVTLASGTVLAAIGWRRSTDVPSIIGYLTVGAGAVGAAALLGALFWARLH